MVDDFDEWYDQCSDSLNGMIYRVQRSLESIGQPEGIEGSDYTALEPPKVVEALEALVASLEST